MLESPPFDEADYLAANDDVAAAVERGDIPSGRFHYQTHGHSERRRLRTRTAWMRSGLDLRTSSGREIGPLCSPVVRKSEGDVSYVDFCDRDQLAATYADDPSVDVEGLVDIDIIWTSGTLATTFGPGRRVDYILASHVVEHVPDLVSWVGELHSVLCRDGRVRLVVPDHRYTFDRYRSATQLHDVLDAYLRRARVPQPRQIIDFMISARKVEVEAAWRGEADDGFVPPTLLLGQALSVARDALENGTYHDTHCWVFTPTSFAALFRDLARLELVPMACRQLHPTAHMDIEFLVEMVPCDDAVESTASWEEALAEADLVERGSALPGRASQRSTRDPSQESVAAR